jgi:nicotinamide-nucleotide amidase
MLDANLSKLAQTIIDGAIRFKIHIVTAESCTGGMVAAALTSISGSSQAFERGFVTYSNRSKTEMLGVPEELIERVGAVSQDVSLAMAEGALTKSGVDLAVSITGIAGPGGGTQTKPVGLVHFATALRDHATLHSEMRFGDLGRDAVRHAAMHHALKMLAVRLEIYQSR